VKWCLAMKWLEISKNCPCRKGEYCVNGLKCSKKNCFLLKGRKAEKEDINWYRQLYLLIPIQTLLLIYCVSEQYIDNPPKTLSNPSCYTLWSVFPLIFDFKLISSQIPTIILSIINIAFNRNILYYFLLDTQYVL